MPQTLADLRSSLRIKLNEASANAWDDADLNDWLNEACREVARRAMHLESLSTFAVTGGTAAYETGDTGLTNVIMVNKLAYVLDGGAIRYDLRYTDVQNQEQLPYFSTVNTQSTPEFFTMWGMVPNLTITLYPTPSQDGTCEIWYWRYPAAMSVDADEAEVPEGWHDLLVTYGVYCALLRDRDERFATYFQKFDADITFLTRMSNRHTPHTGEISRPGSRGLPGWLTGADDWGY